MMAKPKKKIKKHRRGSIMNRSDIPYAERMAMQHHGAIIANLSIVISNCLMLCSYKELCVLKI